MRRQRGWQARLTALVAEVAQTPYAPGQQDCALFAARAIEAMCGEDPAAGWRGRYRSVKGGLRLLRAAGHRDHIAAVTALFDEVHPAFANPGDLAAVDGDDGLPALGVVKGEMIYVLRPEGLGLVPLTDARRAWRV